MANGMYSEVNEVERNAAQSLDTWANHLISRAAEQPIQRHEWLTAFLGQSTFGSRDTPLLGRELAKVEKVRHAIGEPMLMLNGFRPKPKLYLLVKPADYNPEEPETFFKFGLERQRDSYRGRVCCDVVHMVTGFNWSNPTYDFTSVDLLYAVRLMGTLRSMVTLEMAEDEGYGNDGHGYALGMSAIREAVINSHTNSTVHVLESNLDTMRAFAGSRAVVS